MKRLVPLVVLAACSASDARQSALTPPDAAVVPDAPQPADARPAPPPDGPQAARAIFHHGAWMRGATLWVVGDGGEILRHDAGGWSVEKSGVTADLNAITGDATGIWVGGRDGTLIVSTGDGQWSPQGYALPPTALLTTVALADDIVFFGGVEIVGTKLPLDDWHIDIDHKRTYASIAGDHDGQMWATALYTLNTTMPSGDLFRGGTAGWQLVAQAGMPGLPDKDFEVVRVVGSEIVIAGLSEPGFSTHVSRGDGTTWRADPVQPDGQLHTNGVSSMWGIPSDLLIDAGGGVLATDNGILVTDGTSPWRPFMQGVSVSGLAGTTRDFWAVGAAIWHVVDGQVVETR